MNNKLSKIYSIPAYDKLDDKTRAAADGMIYDKLISKSYSKLGQKPPSKVNWLSLDKGSKLALIKDTLNVPAPKPGPGVMENKIYANNDMPASERSKYYTAKFAEGALEFAQGSTSLVSKVVKADLQYTSINPDKESLNKGQDFAEHIFDAPRNAVKSYITSKEPEVNRDLRTKIFGNISSFIPMMMAFEASPAGNLAQVEKVSEGTFKVSGWIAKAGGLTKFLETNPVGRSMVRLTKGAADGYFVSATQTGTPSSKDAAIYGSFETGIPVAGAVSKGVFDGAAKYFSKIANIWGAEFGSSMLALAQRESEQAIKASGVNLSDPLIRRLNETNHKILNDFAREYYGASGYNVLPRAAKREVNKEINKAVAKGYTYPVVFDSKATALSIDTRIREAVKNNPEAIAALDKLRAMSEKIHIPLTSGGVSEAQKETRIAMGETPAIRAEQISKGRTIQKSLPENAAPKTNIRPGAAKSGSKEFTDNTIRRAVSLNMRVEDPEDYWTMMYWKAQNGLVKGDAAKNVIAVYENRFPDMSERIARSEGLVEHIEKLFRTKHVGKADQRGVFRSGEYYTPEYMKAQGIKKTKWQKQLDREDR